MKKFIFILTTAMIPFSILSASFTPSLKMIKKAGSDEIPDRFMTSSKTSRVEWGCPVDELVNANTKAEAMGIIEGQCREQVRRAANGKEDVMDVISTQLLWPDVQVTPAKGGFLLVGTFFLETLVLHRATVEK